MTTTAHTLEEGLERFTLVSCTQGDEENDEACPMALLAWIYGEPFSDHPACAHPIICDHVIRGTDAGTTDEQRRELVRLGMEGALDTWSIPVEVIALAMTVPRDQDPPAPYERAVLLMQNVATWKVGPRERPNLVDANLGGAYLGGADLRGANLRGAYLGGAYLGGANLVDANLGGAYLGGAYLRSAYLRSAYLGGAYLVGAYLVGAYLVGADLRGANLGGANLGGADLRGATGNKYTTLPAGWQVSDAGLIVEDAS